MNLLFVTWDGPQVTYLEGLFLPILRGLLAHGVRSHVIQFSWAPRDSVRKTGEAYEAAGIGYQPLKVRRTPKLPGSVATARRKAIWPRS